MPGEGNSVKREAMRSEPEAAPGPSLAAYALRRHRNAGNAAGRAARGQETQPVPEATGPAVRASASLRAASRNRTAAAAMKPKPRIMQVMTVS